ncbi:MAG: hypothetical protein ACPG1A_02020 [Halioglobus sp.]
MEPLLAEVKRRLEQMFAALAGGADVAPTHRLRTEGLMEAALLAELADEEQIDSLLADCYHAAFGSELGVDFGADWRAFHPFPQIPAVGRRAPVYPSTKD